ncbi:glycosyltransferase family 4 protein [Sphingomonas sp. Leaf4]|uniref:glycosyltransferase family 4 protein n=1 Tax=Sphingomonas sp. Leaf4 TaxID=2876553 RepID=UPI001E5AD4E9|nr:glycosyltransferase family 4 protein [Sphingomonas sp. Leaf4]
MNGSASRKVVFLTHTVFHYRQAFHELVRENLQRDRVDYVVVYGQPDRIEERKNDAVNLSFGRKIRNRYIYRLGQPLIYQPALRALLSADLAIIIQENRLLLNYPVQLFRRLLKPKIALFGHGRNFQSRNPDGRAERFKQFWADKSDWWFGYTEETRSHIAALGFPDDRITVFNNAVDSGTVRRAANAVTAERMQARRVELGLTGNNVAVFVGGLYPDKRLDYLVAAADLIRASVPDFELIVAGGGVDLPLIKQLATSRPWIKVMGPRFGTDKVELMRLGKIFLMPGLLGLAILDAAAAGLPTITTDFPWHSPEIAYLENGVNGLRVQGWDDPAAYAVAVVGLLGDTERLQNMTAAARLLSDNYTIEAMAERFADGVRAALAAGRRG